LHFLRFLPRYKLNRLPPTPVTTLTRFRELAMVERISYIYVDNVAGYEGNNTYCHNCKILLIVRRGFFNPTDNLVGNRCKFCEARIPGAWREA
jgi:pyruvate formate lyase activating enzyme